MKLLCLKKNTGCINLVRELFYERIEIFQKFSQNYKLNHLPQWNNRDNKQQ